jgi:hypothetical protein
MLTFLREVHPLNAKRAIEVTPLGMLKADRFAHGRHCTSPLGLFADAFASGRPNPRHDGNAPSPIEVTLLGMLTLTREVQPRNALSPIEVTLLGMLTLPREVHP